MPQRRWVLERNLLRALSGLSSWMFIVILVILVMAVAFRSGVED